MYHILFPDRCVWYISHLRSSLLNDFQNLISLRSYYLSGSIIYGNNQSIPHILAWCWRWSVGGRGGRNVYRRRVKFTPFTNFKHNCNYHLSKVSDFFETKSYNQTSYSVCLLRNMPHKYVVEHAAFKNSNYSIHNWIIKTENGVW